MCHPLRQQHVYVPTADLRVYRVGYVPQSPSARYSYIEFTSFRFFFFFFEIDEKRVRKRKLSFWDCFGRTQLRQVTKNIV